MQAFATEILVDDETHQAPECGLYIILHDTDDHGKQCFQLGQALHAANRFSSYDLNRHVVEYRPSDVSADNRIHAKAYCETAQKNGFIFLVFDAPELARDVGADGVLCSSIKKCSDARKILPDTAIIGLRCTTRAAAQSALSLELDFVSFYSSKTGDSLLDLVNWWTGSTDKPSAVEGPYDPENCALFVKAGATFIDSTTHIWTHPSGNIMQGVVNMLDAFERHMPAPQTAH